MQTVALIDYGSGNLHSAEKALVRAATEADLNRTITVTDDPAVIAAADRIVLPGVGSFGGCRRALYARPGLVDALREAVSERQRPFLGICVGLQLLADTGLEYGPHAGLGLIPGTVRQLSVSPGQKLPHIGWNDVIAVGHKLIPQTGDAYFVHSYYFDAADPTTVIGSAHYGCAFPAALAKGNVAGTQFHPEKSMAFGLALLGRFMEWEPE